MDWRVDPELVDKPNAQSYDPSTNEMSRLRSPERCFSCGGRFTDSDQVAIISTETGWVCDLPGDLAKCAVWQPGDAEAFHRTCWERLGVAKSVAC